MKSHVELLESFDLYEAAASGRVDREKAILRGVKCLGWSSANHRTYDPDGVNPSLYEGRPVSINHPRPGTDVSAYDRFGRLINARKEADGIYADLEYLASHPLAAAVVEAAERMPSVYGLSHRARGRQIFGKKGSPTGGHWAVEEVLAVDLVGDPACAKGIFESRKGGHMTRTLGALAESLRGSRPQYARALREVAEAGLLDPGAPMDEPPPLDMGGAGEGVDHEQALLDAAKAVIDDDSLDTKSKLKKISAILKLVDNPGEGGGESEGGEGDEESTPAESNRVQVATLKERLARFEARDHLRAAADLVGVKLGDTLLEALAQPGLTAGKAKILLAELKGRGASSGARSAPGLTASVKSAGKGGCARGITPA